MQQSWEDRWREVNNRLSITGAALLLERQERQCWQERSRLDRQILEALNSSMNLKRLLAGIQLTTGGLCQDSLQSIMPKQRIDLSRFKQPPSTERILPCNFLLGGDRLRFWAGKPPVQRQRSLIKARPLYKQDQDLFLQNFDICLTGIIGNNMEQSLDDPFILMNVRLQNIQAILQQDRQEMRNLNRQILQALNRLNAPHSNTRRGHMDCRNLGDRMMPKPMLRQTIRNLQESQRLFDLTRSQSVHIIISHLQRQPSITVESNSEYSFGKRPSSELEKRAVADRVPRQLPLPTRANRLYKQDLDLFLLVFDND